MSEEVHHHEYFGIKDCEKARDIRGKVLDVIEDLDKQGNFTHTALVKATFRELSSFEPMERAFAMKFLLDLHEYDKDEMLNRLEGG